MHCIVKTLVKTFTQKYIFGSSKTQSKSTEINILTLKQRRELFTIFM